MQILHHTTFNPEPSKDNGKAILLIHGWSGMPASVKPLTIALRDAGFTVYTPVLAGHGSTDPRDFAKATMEDWIKDIDAAYAHLRERFEVQNVYLAGISMGALLAVQQAFKKYPTEKLLLLAPALYNRDPSIFVTPLLHFFVKYWKMKKVRENYTVYTEEEQALEDNVYGIYNWVSPAYQLLRMQGLVKKLLRKVLKNYLLRPNGGSRKALIIWANDDEAVQSKAPRKLFEALNSPNSPWEPELNMLHHGKHVIPQVSTVSIKKSVDFFLS